MRHSIPMGMVPALLGLLVGCGSPGAAPGGSAAPAPSSSTTAATAVPLPKGATLETLDMLNARQGWVAGYLSGKFMLWHTNDGGRRWTQHEVPKTPVQKAPNSAPAPVVYFRSANLGWVAWIDRGTHHSTLTVLRTEDAGRHFSRTVKTVPLVMGYVRQLAFVSGADGWLRVFSGGAMNQGDTSIYRTTDGGQSWTLVSSAAGYIPNPAATPDALPELDVPMPMTFTSSTEGWVGVGNLIAIQNSKALLYHSTDAGTTWHPVPLPVPAAYAHNYTSVESAPIFSGGTGSVLVEFQGAQDAVVAYRTANHGTAWLAGAPLVLPRPASAVPGIESAFINPDTGWCIGDAGQLLAETQDGGAIWTKIPITAPLSGLLQQGYRVRQLSMASPRTGWLLLSRSLPTGAVSTLLLKTGDGAKTWSAAS